MSEPVAYAPQPQPVAGQERVLDVLWSWLDSDARALFGDDLIARAEMGKQKYGTFLETFNGREASVDWLEENEDGCMYGMQLCIESYYDIAIVELFQQQLELTKKLKMLVNKRKSGDE